MKRATFALVLFAAACGNGDSTKISKTTAPPTTTPAETPPAAPAEQAATAPMRVEGGFATPESVLYDSTADVYLVSNINGSPFDADGNGFISRVTPDGKIATLKWIDGLNAPKGMTLAGDTLWVTDVTVVRKFDAKTGEPRGEVPIAGATFLNDLTSHDGVVYVSDSGMAPGFKPSGSDAVYSIGADGAVEAVAKDASLNRPNGLAFGDALVMVTFGAAELYTIGDAGATRTAQLPKGGLDGIELTGDGKALISSWECQCVYAGPLNGPFTPAIEHVKAPADIGWDSKRKRVLIPLFEDNAVLIQPAP